MARLLKTRDLETAPVALPEGLSLGVVVVHANRVGMGRGRPIGRPQDCTGIRARGYSRMSATSSPCSATIESRPGAPPIPTSNTPRTSV